MRRWLAPLPVRIGVASALLVAAILVVAIAGALGGDEERPTASPAPSKAPAGRAAPSGSPGALPPQLVKCFADQGFDVSSPAEIHSAPPQVVQECFGALHRGGGAP